MSYGPWEGLSLRFVRTVLGLPPWYATAADARVAVGSLLSGIPPAGAVCWYKTSRYGNIALSVGEVDGGTTQVMCVRQGWPTLRRYDDAVLGEYEGWSRQIVPPYQTIFPVGEFGLPR